MTRYGTSHFVSEPHALNYYLDYEPNPATARAMVDRKIKEGEIHIGPPKLKPREKLVKIDKGRRYGIETQ